jgi:type VI protein secretion system component VasF
MKYHHPSAWTGSRQQIHKRLQQHLQQTHHQNSIKCRPLIKHVISFKILLWKSPARALSLSCFCLAGVSLVVGLGLQQQQQKQQKQFNCTTMFAVGVAAAVGGSAAESQYKPKVGGIS